VGYFQSYRWGGESQIALKKSLNFISKSATIETYESLAESEIPLVVHVRLGDYLLENGFGTPSPEYYAQAIKYALSTGTYGKIWLYSDDLPRAISLLPSDLDIELRMIDEIDASPTATLETMRFGKGYVIANSTFSWWGAFLSYSDNPLVIYPSPWFKSIESPAKLVPPTWVPFESK
jgi:predicted nucleic acid-binding Zn finger protein